MTHHRLIRLFALTAALALPAAASAQNAAPVQPAQMGGQTQQGQPGQMDPRQGGMDQNRGGQQAQQTQRLQVTYYANQRGKDTVLARKTLTVQGQGNQSERRAVIENAPRGADYARVTSRSGTYTVTLHQNGQGGNSGNGPRR